MLLLMHKEGILLGHENSQVARVLDNPHEDVVKSTRVIKSKVCVSTADCVAWGSAYRSQHRKSSFRLWKESTRGGV